MLQRCYVECSWGPQPKLAQKGGGPELQALAAALGSKAGGVRSGSILSATTQGTLALEKCSLVWLATDSWAPSDLTVIIEARQQAKATIRKCQLLSELPSHAASMSGITTSTKGKAVVDRSLLRGCCMHAADCGILKATHVVMQAQAHVHMGSPGGAGAGGGAMGAAAASSAASTGVNMSSSGGGNGHTSSSSGRGVGISRQQGGMSIMDGSIVQLSSCTLEGFEAAVEVRCRGASY